MEENKKFCFFHDLTGQDLFAKRTPSLQCFLNIKKNISRQSIVHCTVYIKYFQIKLQLLLLKIQNTHASIPHLKKNFFYEYLDLRVQVNLEDVLIQLSVRAQALYLLVSRGSYIYCTYLVGMTLELYLVVMLTDWYLEDA